MKPWRSMVAIVPTPMTPAATSAPPSRRRAFFIYSRKLLFRLLGLRGASSRYTIAKFHDFDSYARRTTARRHTAVILLTPLPSLLSSLLPALVPLQDPALGVHKNTGFLVHFLLTLAIVIFGSVHQMRAPSGISKHDLSHTNAVAIAMVGAVLLALCVTAMSILWRFPVPFVWITALGPFVMTLVLAHVIVLRRKLWRTDALRRPLLLFLPAYVVQASQVVIYPVFSTIFEVSDVWGQVALTLLFPVVKLFYRSVTRKLLRHLDEDSNEVAVSGIEICAAMYQSMIMQSLPSVYATAIIMGLDATQSILHIYVLMAKQSTVPQAEIVPTARRLLFSPNSTITERDLADDKPVKQKITTKIFSVRPMKKPKEKGGVATTSTDLRPRTLSARSTQKRLVKHALEIMQAAEAVLIVEYFEVSIPICNAFYILWASRFDSAVYNPKLRPYYYDSRTLEPAIRTLALYTALQALSLITVYVLLRRRFGLAARALLAFVLERHAWSLQGKLITWFSLLFQFPVAHYGVDFTFKFDFAREHMGPDVGSAT